MGGILAFSRNLDWGLKKRSKDDVFYCCIAHPMV